MQVSPLTEVMAHARSMLRLADGRLSGLLTPAQAQQSLASSLGVRG